MIEIKDIPKMKLKTIPYNLIVYGAPGLARVIKLRKSIERNT